MEAQAGERRHQRALWYLGLVATALALFYAGAELSQSDWDAAGVLSFGQEDPERIGYALEQFDRQIPLADALGHDGKYFFIQAMDPLFLNPEEHAAYLDRPTYRAQRMLYPLVAGSFGLGDSDRVAWAMLAINVVAFVVGAVFTGRLAQTFGLSAWLGLAFALNPGVRFELDIDGAGVVAMAALMGGLLSLRSNRWRLALLAFTFAVLAREVMLIAVVGIAASRAAIAIRRRVLLIAVPGGAAAIWWAFVQLRLGDLSDSPSVEEIGLPLAGIWNAFGRWMSDPGIDMALGLVFVFLAVMMLVRAARYGTMIEMAGAGFAVLGLMLTERVWFRHFDISRALSPLLTLYLISVAISLRSESIAVPDRGRTSEK